MSLPRNTARFSWGGEGGDGREGFFMLYIVNCLLLGHSHAFFFNNYCFYERGIPFLSGEKKINSGALSAIGSKKNVKK